jgi:hypothetical protein
MRIGTHIGPVSVSGNDQGCAAGCLSWFLGAAVVFALLAWPYETIGHGADAWLAEIGWLAFLAALGVVVAVARSQGRP